LPSLTAEDLKDLGVNLVGHRRPCSTPAPRSALRSRRSPTYPRALMPSAGS
jgi:hypothetical protein